MKHIFDQVYTPSITLSEDRIWLNRQITINTVAEKLTRRQQRLLESREIKHKTRNQITRIWDKLENKRSGKRKNIWRQNPRNNSLETARNHFNP